MAWRHFAWKSRCFPTTECCSGAAVGAFDGGKPGKRRRDRNLRDLPPMSLFPDPAVEHPRRTARLAPDTINDGQQRDLLNDATADRIVPQHLPGAADPHRMTGRPGSALETTARAY